ncbi:MAG TPA: ABC transporter substrate-binding protein [Gemmatimonadales bacterium]|nr:ABC transporter substrate-binding protein [Gemmatimonadales bacterium]
MSHRWFIPTAPVLVTALALLAACGGGERREQGPIRVGSILSVTGGVAFIGDPMLKTLQLYVERINAQGGVDGRPVELVHYDDASDAAKANAFAKRLIESDEVDLIIGPTTTGAALAILPLVERAGVPMLALCGGVVVVEPVRKWAFKIPVSDRMSIERDWEDMRARGITRVAILSETTGLGQSSLKEADGTAGRHGITILARETYGQKDSDVTPQLTRLRNVRGVQAILILGSGQGAVLATRNFHQLGIELPLYHTHGVVSNEFIRLAGAAAEGARLSTTALVLGERLASDDPVRRIVLDYVRVYRERYGEEPAPYGGYAYDALMIAVEAIRKAGGTDRAKVRDAIEGISYVGTQGTTTMSPTDHIGLPIAALRMVEIRKGAWVPVE